MVTQARAIKNLDVSIVADLDEAAARQAYHRAGLTDDDIVVCENRQAMLTALEQGKAVIVADAMLLMEAPIDIIVESTGMPEAGALHALAAIEHSKHIAMVNKETDITVGPILKYLADLSTAAKTSCCQLECMW